MSSTSTPTWNTNMLVTSRSPFKLLKSALILFTWSCHITISQHTWPLSCSFPIVWLNAFPQKSGISIITNPHLIMMGMKLDYNKHWQVSFGAYVEVHDDPLHMNSDEQCTHPCICLGPVGTFSEITSIWASKWVGSWNVKMVGTARIWCNHPTSQGPHTTCQTTMGHHFYWL